MDGARRRSTDKGDQKNYLVQSTDELKKVNLNSHFQVDVVVELLNKTFARILINRNSIKR